MASIVVSGQVKKFSFVLDEGEVMIFWSDIQEDM